MDDELNILPLSSLIGGISLVDVIYYLKSNNNYDMLIGSKKFS